MSSAPPGRWASRSEIDRIICGDAPRASRRPDRGPGRGDRGPVHPSQAASGRAGTDAGRRQRGTRPTRGDRQAGVRRLPSLRIRGFGQAHAGAVGSDRREHGRPRCARHQRRAGCDHRLPVRVAQADPEQRAQRRRARGQADGGSESLRSRQAAVQRRAVSRATARMRAARRRDRISCDRSSCCAIATGARLGRFSARRIRRSRYRAVPPRRCRNRSKG